MMSVYVVIFILSAIALVLFSQENVWQRYVVSKMLSEKNLSLFKRLYSDDEAVRKQREHCGAKLRLFCEVVCVFSLMAMGICYREFGKKDVISDYRIERGDYDSPKREISVDIYNRSGTKLENKRISVMPRKYTNEKATEMCDEIKAVLPGIIVADNPSMDEIATNLNLPSCVEGYPFSITWKSQSPLLVSSDGVIDTKRLSERLESSNEDGILVTLCAEIEYDDFREESYYPIRLVKPVISARDRFLEDVTERIAKFDEVTETEAYMILPKEVDGIEIDYKVTEDNTAVFVMLMGLLLAPIMAGLKDNEPEKKALQRDEEMMADYVRIIDQYVLYYSAGVPTKGIWSAICADYEKRLKKGGKKRYAYEQMLTTMRAMNEGVGESKAYEDFAMRCRLPKYRAFAGLIEQALTKGSEHMSKTLTEESVNASKERKRLAQQMGEKAGTKILLPMFMMLAIVVVIVIVPAFMSFKM